MNILIIRVSAIGDVIHTFPAVALLRHHFPNANIHWIVQEKAADLVKINKLVNNVWTLPDHFTRFHHWPSLMNTLHHLKSTMWDGIIDFQGNIKAALLRLALHGPSFGFTYRHAREGISSYAHEWTTDAVYTNIIQKNLTLASFAADHLSGSAFTSSPTLQELHSKQAITLDGAICSQVDTWLKQHALENYIIIAPNTTWPSKHWPDQHWLTLLTNLSLNSKCKNFSIILVGASFGKQGRWLSQAIKQLTDKIICFPAWGLQHVTYLVKHAALVIAPDTGILHLSDYLGVRTLGIFGPTNAQRHGPFLSPFNKKHAVQIKCPHHYRKNHTFHKKHVPTKDCMYTLMPDHMEQVVLNILSLS